MDGNLIKAIIFARHLPGIFLQRSGPLVARHGVPSPFTYACIEVVDSHGTTTCLAPAATQCVGEPLRIPKEYITVTGLATLAYPVQYLFVGCPSST